MPSAIAIAQSRDELLADFLYKLGKSALARKSQEDYERQVLDFLRFLDSTGDEHEPFLDAIGAAGAVAAWKRFRLYERKLSASNINQGLAAVDLFYRYALGLRFEVDRVPMPAPGEPKSLTRSQEAALKRAADRGTSPQLAPVEAAIVFFLLGTGARLGEASALARDDLALTARTSWVTLRGKGDTTRRVKIPAPRPRERLDAYLAQRRDPLAELWISPSTGRPLTRRGIQDMVRRLGKAAGIEGLSPHDLRHTCARNLLDAGEDIAVVQRILGHESIKTTQKYVRPSEERMAQNVDRILG